MGSCGTCFLVPSLTQTTSHTGCVCLCSIHPTSYALFLVSYVMCSVFCVLQQATTLLLAKGFTKGDMAPTLPTLPLTHPLSPSLIHAGPLLCDTHTHCAVRIIPFPPSAGWPSTTRSLSSTMRRSATRIAQSTHFLDSICSDAAPMAGK